MSSPSAARWNAVDWLLGRGSSSERGVPALDGLRGLAVLMVFVCHSWSLSGRPTYSIGSFSFEPIFAMLDTGVDLFFVLSGFLIARKFLIADHEGRPQAKLGTYYRERFFRIVPMYWLILVAFVTVMTPWLAAEPKVFSRDGLAAMLMYIPVLSTLFPWSYGRWLAIGPVWTLTIEVLFYAMMPLAYRWFTGRRWRWMLPLSFAISIGWLAFLRSTPGSSFAAAVGRRGRNAVPGRDFGRIVLTHQLPAFWFAFAIGISVAVVHVHRRARPVAADTADAGDRAWVRLLLPVGAVLAVLAWWLLGRTSINNGRGDPFIEVRSTEAGALLYYYFQHLAPTAAYGLILAGVVLSTRRHRLLGSSVLRAVGILGYGIYLWHFPILFGQTGLAWIVDLDPAVRLPVALVVGGFTTVLLSTLTWFALERPMIARGKRRTRAVDRNEPGVRAPVDSTRLGPFGGRPVPTPRITP
jgi:peptidoglycan/LPS O-acetylase OafA/YrhL